jgi:nucleolar protein 4
VKQVKILRDVDKAREAKAKSAKSKGFAFVELTEHEHALCALRQLNNNPIPFGACLHCVSLTACQASMATQSV